MGDNVKTLDLLQILGRKVGEIYELSDLVEHIVKMCRIALQASAASVLLYEPKSHSLYFEIAQGEAGKALRKINIRTGSGIAGWVFKHNASLIVNDVSRDPRFDSSMDEASGFVTRSIICVPLTVHRETIGVLEVLNKLDVSDFTNQDKELLESVASLAAITLENSSLHKSVLSGYKSTIEALASAIDAKDASTSGHSRRVMEYSILFGREIGLSKKNLEILEYAGLLHDIGKIGISDSILCKSSSLTPDEFKIIRTHSLIGSNILKDVPFLQEAREMVLHHHERYDGRGYPDGLVSEQIPLGARLLALADTYDSMTTDRYYRAALSCERAITEIKQGSGTQFWPQAVEAFMSLYDKGALNKPVSINRPRRDAEKLTR